jgi:hypothetical protein
VARDSVYWLGRIKNEAPTVHSSYLDGKYKSVAEARRAAGLFSPRTRLHELRNAWTKASRREQADFLRWLRPMTPAKAVVRPPTVGAPTAAKSPSATVGCRLEPWAALRIKTIMRVRALKMGQVMLEMGCLKFDASLTTALTRGWRIDERMIPKLDGWLEANKSVS